jgi:predicted RNA binding protein YcfA (HicA-like mRNA interferase family)
MKLPRHVWQQIKNLSPLDLMKALEKDQWSVDMASGSKRVYRHSNGRQVAIHYHPGTTYGPKLLKTLIEDIGWTENDMRRLKLIK